jgi:hypothetical protein
MVMKLLAGISIQKMVIPESIGNRVRNLTRGIELQGTPYTDEMLNSIEKGGLMNMLKEKMQPGKEINHAE